jgi:murein DD-endopeptidase MepM/ murein hydrolase activator NlpD
MLPKKRKVLVVISLILSVIFIINITDFYKELNFPINSKYQTDWDKSSYWKYPWSEGKVHKGIDIFGQLHTPIISSVYGIVLESGYSNNGGNYIYIISYDLKVYYYAHLSKKQVNTLDLISKNQQIGLMGDTGSAKYSPIHLHFSIFSIVPLFRNYDSKSFKGGLRMFYPNPSFYFN